MKRSQQTSLLDNDNPGGPGCQVVSEVLPWSQQAIFDLLVGPCMGHRRKLPLGHKYFHSCLREQQARFLVWLMRLYECWFFTGTFNKFGVRSVKPLTPAPAGTRHFMKPDAYTRLHSFLARLNQAHNSISGATPLLSVSRGEMQQRDVLHFHVLIFGNRLGHLSRKRWEDRWLISAGGFARNYAAEDNGRVARYLVAHETRDGLGGNLDLGGSLRGLKPPGGISRCCSRNGSRGLAIDGSMQFKAIGLSVPAASIPWSDSCLDRGPAQ